MADVTSISHAAGTGTTEAQYLAAAHHSVILGNVYAVAASNSSAVHKSAANASVTTGGLVCSGTADQTNINTFISNRSAGDIIWFLPGTYNITASIVGKSGVSLIWNKGAIPSATGLAASDAALDLQGTTGSATTLNGAHAAGALTITLTDATGYADGDYIFIYDSATIWKSNNLSQKKGEIVQAYGAPVANVITLRGVLADSYATLSTVVKITPFKDAVIKGFSPVGDDNVTGIDADYLANCSIEDFNPDSMATAGLEMTNCIDTNIIGAIGEKCNQGGLGYLVGIYYCCQNLHLSGLRSNFSRHAVAIGGGTGNGIPRNIFVSNSFSYNNRNAGTPGGGFDCHYVGENVWFNNCHAIRCYQGFNMGQYTGGMVGCSAYDCSDSGVYMAGANTVDLQIIGGNFCRCKYGLDLEVDNVHVIGANVSENYQHGIVILGVDNGEISHCRVIGNGTTTDNTYDNIHLDTDANGWSIRFNRVHQGTGTNQSYAGIAIWNATCDNNIVEGNDVTNGGNSHLIYNVGTGTKIRNNTGYVTENSGTGTIANGATTAVITHGLSYTPVLADITVTLGENPTNTPGAIWVDTITATQFTVNCENDPGISALDFSWSVRKN